MICYNIQCVLGRDDEPYSCMHDMYTICDIYD